MMTKDDEIAKKIVAVGLMSGGLDSILAGMLVAKQGIEVVMVTYCTPFFPCSDEKKARLERICKQIGAKLKIVDVSEEYSKVVRDPKHGYGKNMNPCIDCKVFFLKQAKKLAKQIEAKFIFTGEVVGQRPMSQKSHVLKMIEKEVGLQGKLLRPLSALNMAETEAEKEGWIDRSKLQDIHGRGRKVQISLAKELGITEYQTPAGGCLLTERFYCNRLKDLFGHEANVSKRELDLLRYGRHFRVKNAKIIVGKDEKDNDELLRFKGKSDYKFEAVECSGPITLLIGEKTEGNIEFAAALTARYSSCKGCLVVVRYGREKLDKVISVKPISGIIPL